MKSYLEKHMRDALVEHKLEEITDSKSPVRAFRMFKDARRVMSCLIVSTPEGIFIQGDIAPGSSCSANQSLEWFSRPMDEDYLCSKFLTKSFYRETALSALREHLEENPDHEDLKELTQNDGDDFRDPDFQERIYALGFEDAGYDYDSGSAGWLCAIHERFVALYPRLENKDA
jgi:hypothetical protein